jgi:predicted nucleotidyltransferase
LRNVRSSPLAATPRSEANFAVLQAIQLSDGCEAGEAEPAKAVFPAAASRLPSVSVRCPDGVQGVIDVAGRKLAAAARNPVKVVLFSSHARGDAGPDSDLDFLVIERDVPDCHAEMVRLEREVRSLGVPSDVVVVSEAYASEWANVRNSIVHAALSEGREFAAA